MVFTMNLWADFDNQHVPAEAARHKSTRRLTEQGILSSLRKWLVQDYASAYCRSLAAMRIYRRCYWIDAWGIDSGRARSEMRSAEGSYEPLLQPLLSLSKVLAHESRSISLNGIEHSPAVFLLNPFGHTLFIHDDLAPLYQRASAPTELCLLVPHKQVELRLMAASHTAASAPALTALLRTDRWKALLPNGEGAEVAEVAAETKETGHALDGMIDLLLASVQQHFPWVQRIALPIQVGPAVV